MDALSWVIFAAVVAIALAIYLVKHHATETKIVSVVEAEAAKLKAHFQANPTVQKIEAAVEPTLVASITDLHAKIDAIREKLGGVYTDVEKSQIVQDLEARVQQAETAFQALASGVHDAQALRNALAGTPAAAAAPPASGEATASQSITAGAVGA